MAVWINEFHYDNTGADAGEFIEVAGTAGTSLTGWTLVLYNGNGGAPYATLALSGTIADQQGGFGTVAVAAPSLQNGAPDGIALVDGTGTTVQFLSYEGSLTAAGGPAEGLTSTDVGLAQAGDEPVGAAIALTGTGDEPGDFTWAETNDDTPGAVNGGQTLGGGGGSGIAVTISDASVLEGDAGTAFLTFTVARSETTGDFAVDYVTQDGTATTADGDYVATGGTLAFTAGGASSQTVAVTVNGDTAAEPDETLSVVLSNLASAAGSATLADATGNGTIRTDEVALTRISAIQGAGHKSPEVGGAVGEPGNSGTSRFNVEGVVTAVTANGFWMQDPTGDGDDATADGVFVFTSSAPAAGLGAGDAVRVLGARADEFRPGGSGGGNNLTVTQLNATAGVGATVQDLGPGAPILPVVLGVDRAILTGAIEDDGFASFDPATNAIDFWESLEGMLVEVPASVAVSPTAAFRTRSPDDPANAEGPPNQEIWVRVPANTDDASLTPGGGLILGPTDANPERIQLDDLLPLIAMPEVDVGARLAPVRGVVNYDFGNYEVLVGAAPLVAAPSPIAPETTALARDARQVTIASYNVENLDPQVESTDPGRVEGSDLYTRLGNSDDDVGSGKYARHAEQTALNMGAPTIVALQEVQDNDGAEISSDVDATRTLQTLVDLIGATYGVAYAFAFENPPAPNQDGGQPNANIRPAFLYRPDQVALLDTIRLTDPDPAEADGFPGDDFAASRKPLVGVFEANGVWFTLINNHFNSKGGDDALFGNVQPPVLSSEAQRIEQARIVNGTVRALEAADPEAKVVVLGDLNDFTWSNPLQVLMGAGSDRILFDLAEELLPENGRYSYNFQGNAQTLDHTLVNRALLAGADPAFDIVHVNSEFADQVSDHDPSVARLDFRAFAEVLRFGAGADAADGMGGDDTVSGGGGDDALDGGAGDDGVLGQANDDALRGGAGGDRLAGGGGAHLHVLRAADGPGRDVIADFNAAEGDAILLDGFAVESGEAALAASRKIATGMQVDLGEVRRLLRGVSLSELDAADFVFA